MNNIISETAEETKMIWVKAIHGWLKEYPTDLVIKQLEEIIDKAKGEKKDIENSSN